MAELTLYALSKDGLVGFAIVEMTEVYETNEDGRKTKSVGFFEDHKIAEAFANLPKTDRRKTGKYWILTNGQVGFLVAKDPVILLKDEEALLKIKEGILAKLSPEEKELLGKI